MKQVYLAGRVNGDKWKVAPKIDGIEYVSSDGGDHSEHDWGNSVYQFNNESLKDGVRLNALALIEKCDMLIAYLNDADSFGSIAEIAFAASIGKPVHVIVKQNPCPDDYSMFNAYWFVCHFPGVVVQEICCDCMAEKTFKKILGLG